MEKIVQGESIILKLHEDLIASNVKQFNLNVLELLEEDEDHDELILDLGETENIDSVGVTLLLAYKAAIMRDDSSCD